MNAKSHIQATRILTESSHTAAGAVTSTVKEHLYAGEKGRTQILDRQSSGYEIERRDLRRRFRVFLARKKYQVTPLFDLATEQERAAFEFSGRHWMNWQKRAVRSATREVQINVTYQPTADEQLMFGSIARHWIIRRRDDHDHKLGEHWMEATTNAWYLDTQELSARFASFSSDLIRHPFCFVTGGDERPVINRCGESPSGLCALTETKSLWHITLPSGEAQERTETSCMKVISIGEVSAPMSVFEPPKGFREIPVYPSRFAIERLNMSRRLKQFLRILTWRLSLGR